MRPPYKPRPYQQPFLDFMSAGGKRAFLVWHRRAGKNISAWQWMYSEALLNVGLYYYVFPSLKQGRKILWEGKTGEETGNEKFIDYIDPDWIWPNPKDGVNNTEMTVKLRHPLDRTKEGSMIQIVGTRSDSGKSEAEHLRGTNPRGIIMDEYSEHNPIAWEILAPILVESNGWALFTMTPKGPNHAFKMYQHVKDNPDWFVQCLDVTMTTRENGLPVVSQEAIENERLEGKDEVYIQQEYYVSWAGISQGSYYTKQLDFMRKEDRFRPNLYDPNLDCFTTWDIGHDEAMVCLIGQAQGNFVRWIDGFKVEQKDLRWAWQTLQDMRYARGYTYACHYFPWDMGVHEWGASQGRLRSARDLGMRNIHIAKKLSIDEGHTAVRTQFGNWSFDSHLLGWAIDDLGMYAAKKDEKTGLFSDTPERSKFKHTADAIRTFAVSEKVPSHDMVAKLPTQCQGMYDIFEGTSNNGRSRLSSRGMYSSPSGRA